MRIKERIKDACCTNGCTAACKNQVSLITALTFAAGAEPFIQRAEIQAWSVTIDYKPRRLDVAALRQGDFLEVRRPCWRLRT